VTRWLVLFLGLAIAAGAVYLLAAGVEGDGAPQDDIDASSRARMERVLQQADRESRKP
jgi:hypothetical protein